MKRKIKINLFIIIEDDILLVKDLKSFHTFRNVALNIDYISSSDNKEVSLSIDKQKAIIQRLLPSFQEEIKRTFNIEPIEMTIINSINVDEVNISADVFYVANTKDINSYKRPNENYFLIPVVNFYNALSMNNKDSILVKFLKQNLPQLNLVN